MKELEGRIHARRALLEKLSGGLPAMGYKEERREDKNDGEELMYFKVISNSTILAAESSISFGSR